MSKQILIALIGVAIGVIITILSFIFNDYASMVYNQITWGQFFSGISSGIVVTIAFFLLRLYLRPNIELSEKLVRRNKESYKIVEGKEKRFNEVVYQFKIINKTFFNVENIEVDVFLMNDYFAGEDGKKNYTLLKLPLKVDSFKFMKGMKNRSKTWYDNCYNITISESDFDLKNAWDNNSWVHLQLSSYHSVSGFRKVVVQKYHDKSTCLKTGNFKSGETFDINEEVI